MADVLGEGALAAEIVDHHGVVDDEIDGRERIDLLGVAAEVAHGRAHGREVDDRGHAGEILHQHAGRAIGDLAIRAAVLQPGGHGLDVIDLLTVRPSSWRSRFSNSTLSETGQARQIAQAGLLGGGEAVIVVGTRAHFQAAAGLQAVQSGAHVQSPQNNGCARPVCRSGAGN